MKFPGSVTVFNYQVSVSGLKADEDVFIAVVILSKVLQQSIEATIHDIEETGGLLPGWCQDKTSYHWKI